MRVISLDEAFSRAKTKAIKRKERDIFKRLTIKRPKRKGFSIGQRFKVFICVKNKNGTYRVQSRAKYYYKTKGTLYIREVDNSLRHFINYESIVFVIIDKMGNKLIVRL